MAVDIVDKVAHQACDAGGFNSFRELAVIKLAESMVRRKKQSEALRLLSSYIERFGSFKDKQTLIDLLQVQ